MSEVMPVKFKGERLRTLLGVYRNFRARCTEDPHAARRNQQEFARKVWAGETVNLSDIKGVIAQLGISKYAVIGGNAAILYGARRTTVDIDIIAAKSTVDALATGYKSSPMTVGGSTITVKGFVVDLLHWHDPDWLGELLSEAVVHDGVRVATPQWLVVLKLMASRDIDVGDIIAVTREMTPAQVDRTRELIGRLLPNDAQDFENLLALGKLT